MADGQEQVETDVLIAGAGIAGAALAAALKGSGQTVLLLEKSADPLDSARGDHLQPSTLDILRRWGVLDLLFAAGAEKRLGSAWYSAVGERLLYSSFADLDIAHPYYLYLNHEKIGSTLLDFACDDPSISIERPIRNWWLEERDPAGSVLRVGRADGSDLRVRTRVLVGADGRSSRVRKTFGFSAASYRYERPIAVLFGQPASRCSANDLEVHLTPEHMVAVIPRTGGLCKIGIPIDTADVSAWRKAGSTELKVRLKSLLPNRDFDELTFADVYPPIYLRADTWVRDNIVLIGDACHAMHPARSQGMNTSIRCIDALASALRACAGSRDRTVIGKALADYEAALKPGIDAMLEVNHQHGLEMDASGEENYQKTCESLAVVQASPPIRAAFAMNAAGFASGAPA